MAGKRAKQQQSVVTTSAGTGSSGRAASKASSKPVAASEVSVEAETAPTSRVVYIGHLPHGFFEKQLLGFFSQFGKLTRVRMSRNKKTGAAKHYAFLEFAYHEIATIAAEAMDGYFMFKQKISCKVMPADKIHPQLFAGANKKFRNIPWAKIERQRHDKELTMVEYAQRLARSLKRDRKRANKIKSAGLDFEYDALATQLPAKATKMVFDE